MIPIKYKLYENAENDPYNVVENVLNNRGIDDINAYFNISEKDEIPYSKLKNIEWAVKEFDDHFCKKNKIGILVDTDVDGYTSGAVMYNYIKDMDNDYPLTYIMHNHAKAHGLGSDIVLPDDIELLIIPDASSNNVKECKELREKGISIIILDHHDCDVDNPYAIVVNNQLSEEYSNKDLSGVGVVYKFCQALDDYYMQDYCDNNIDLVSLGLIGDVMDMRSFETKYLVEKGLSNINNECYKSLLKAQSYSMNDIVNIHNIQWYIVPVMNAMIRVGELEEKELLFRALINDYEEFDYKKRGAGIVKENIYDRVARLCKNAKSRQTRVVDKNFKELSERVASENSEDKVIIVRNTEPTDNSITGLVCMKLADKFDKPCILLNDNSNKNPSADNLVYSGSARNVRHSACENFKDTIQNTQCFNFAQGHQGAFGVSIDDSMIEEARNKLNELFKNIPNDKIYIVDFVLDEDEVDTRFIKDLEDLSSFYGQGIEEPSVVVKVKLNKEMTDLLGKEKNTISYVNDSGIKFVMFKCDNSNKLLYWYNNSNNNSIYIEAVGKPCINIFQGIATPQFIIDDFNVIEETNEFLDENDGEDIWE